MNPVSTAKTFGVALLAATTIWTTCPRPARASWYGDLYHAATDVVETGANAVAGAATTIYHAAGDIVDEVVVPVGQTVADTAARAAGAVRDGAVAVADWTVRHRHLVLGAAAVACTATGVGAAGCIAGAVVAFAVEDAVTRAVEGRPILSREGAASIGLHAAEGLLWSLPAVGKALQLSVRIGTYLAAAVEGGAMFGGLNAVDQLSSGGAYNGLQTAAAVAVGAGAGAVLQFVLPPIGQLVKSLLRGDSVSMAARAMVGSFRSEISGAYREVARRAGVRNAWKLEQRALLEGRATPFTRSLTEAEREVLAADGRLAGYEGHHACSVAVCPGLAADPDNIVLIHEAVHDAIHAGGRLTMGPRQIPVLRSE